ncbi:MAG TPA: YHS domain-containing protein [Anaerolineales bacterium]|nr:YHS domain-containing protein [Anaerolineales bacterium]
MAIDPVCGMEVEEKTAAHKSDHGGQTYYFCSPGCKRSFDQNPEKYTAAGSSGKSGHAAHHP